MWSAKRHALQVLRGSKEFQYAKSWIMQRRKTNHGTVVFIGCDNLTFQNVCLCRCLQEGFLSWV